MKIPRYTITVKFRVIILGLVKYHRVFYNGVLIESRGPNIYQSLKEDMNRVRSEYYQHEF